jgi:hypothetical protein
MILTVEADDSDQGRFAIAVMQGALMSYINHIERAGYARDANGAMRATFCDQPLADTTIEKLAREETNEPATRASGEHAPRRNGRLRRGPLSLR